MHEQAQPHPLLASTAGDGDGTQLALLKVLAQRPELSQRQLSELLGLSLGKTHYLLRALLGKGLVKVHNFRRSDRKRAYAYVLTPSGLRERVRMTKAFLAHKEVEFEMLERMIATLRTELIAQEGSEPAALL